jgi:hypothetical protein
LGGEFAVLAYIGGHNIGIGGGGGGGQDQRLRQGGDLMGYTTTILQFICKFTMHLIDQLRMEYSTK